MINFFFAIIDDLDNLKGETMSSLLYSEDENVRNCLMIASF
jgi:hypothetical protein